MPSAKLSIGSCADMTDGTDSALLSVSDLKVEFGDGPGHCPCCQRHLFRCETRRDARHRRRVRLRQERDIAGAARPSRAHRARDVWQGDLDGRDLLQMPDGDLRRIRGKDIAMIFQDPMSSLNPVHRVGSQIREALTTHFDMSAREADARVIELLYQVGIPSAKSRAFDYPHNSRGA